MGHSECRGAPFQNNKSKMRPFFSILRSGVTTAGLVIAGCGNPEAVSPECPTPHDAQATSYEGYKLVWSDEFNEPGRPSAHWSYEQGFVRNHELQWYQPDNAIVENGCLIITGKQERVDNPTYDSLSSDWRQQRPYADFTSSSLTTERSFTFRYGRLEVRARIPVASGAWPAIWTLGNRWEWPANGEIDLMEFYRRDKPIILANACWQGSGAGEVVWDESVVPYAHFTDSDPQWASKFHLWRMDWDADRIQLLLDGELLNEINLRQADRGGGPQCNVNPFSNDCIDFGHYILIKLALGSNGGTPDLSKFPLRYEIDYVRVYQKTTE